MPEFMLTKGERYAATGLFGVALSHSRSFQTHAFGFTLQQPDPVAGNNHTPSIFNDLSGLLRPVFEFLEVDDKLWDGLKEATTGTAGKDQARAFTSLLVQESGESSEKKVDQELGLSKGVDSMASSMETSAGDCKHKEVKRKEYADEYREKYSSAETKSNAKVEHTIVPDEQLKNEDPPKNNAQSECSKELDKSPLEEAASLGHPRKITVLYELLSACLANAPENTNEATPCKTGYDARHRVALRLLATWFDVKWIKVEAIEKIVASSAMALLEEGPDKNDQTPESPGVNWKREGIIGAAAITGGTLMAVTGGLAAPAIAAGMSALAPTLGTIVPVIGASGFAAAASAAGSTVGSAAVTASFGAAGAGLTGSKMARRTGDVEEFEFKPTGENHNQGRLAVEILVSGFVFEEEDFRRPWEGLVDNAERYTLQWESENLIAISTAIQDWLTSKVTMELMKQGAMMTVLSSLVAALAWPAALLTLSDVIDSKWAIALDRSDKAGIILADVLLKGHQGHRPVSLVGFSLGAKVIFKCLEVLAEHEHGAGIVERVVLLGSPISILDSNWEAARKVVAGRFLNVYSSNDWMLGFAFRANLLTQGLAGIQAVEVPGIENVEVTHLIEGHSSYLWITQQILEQLEMDSAYPVVYSTSVKS